MSGFVPSVRDCLQRLDRLRDTGVVVADLDRLNAEMWADEPACELTNASERMVALHQLALHMAANLNAGVGVPATPVPVQRAIVRHAPLAIAHAHVPPPSAEPERRYFDAPRGMVDSKRFRDRLGLSTAYFHTLRRRGRIPEPEQGGGRGVPAFWHEATVATTVAAFGGPLK